LETRNKLQELLDNLFDKKKKLSLQDNRIIVEVEDGKQIELASLSSGEKQILYILMNALDAGPSSFIIDEPEISMHIDWQNQLIASILQVNPNTQLIVATHSVEIMEEITDDRIFPM